MEKEEKVQYLVAAFLSMLVYGYLELTYTTGLGTMNNFGYGGDNWKLLIAVLVIILGVVVFLIALDFLVAGTVPDFLINLIAMIYFLILGALLIIFQVLNILKI